MKKTGLIMIAAAILLIGGCSREPEKISTDLAGKSNVTVAPRATVTPKQGKINTPILISGTEQADEGMSATPSATEQQPGTDLQQEENNGENSVETGSLEIEILATPTPRLDYETDFQALYQKTEYGYGEISHTDFPEDDLLSQAVLTYIDENPMSREYLPKLIAVHYENIYTEEEITAAIDRLDIDFGEVALAFAVDELEEGCHSENDLKHTMELLKFTEDEIDSAMSVLKDYDWSIEADEYVESLLADSFASIEYIRAEMDTAGFTKKQIDASTKKLETMDWDGICLSQMRKWVTEYGWNISEAETFMEEKGWTSDRLAKAKESLNKEIKK